MDTTATLREIFLQSEDELKNVLIGKKVPDDYQEIAQIISNHITKLVTSDNSFRNKTTYSEAEYLNYTLQMLIDIQNLSLARLSDNKSALVAWQSPQKSKDKEDSAYDESALLISSILVGGIVIGAAINPLATLGSIIGLSIGEGLFEKKDKKEKKSSKYPPATTGTVSSGNFISEQTINNICNSIERFCSKIDNLISKIRSDRNELISKYQNKIDDIIKGSTLDKKYPQILSSMQYLYMDNKNNDTKNESIATMLFQFASYGYNFLEYSPGNEKFFTSTIKTDIDKPEMYLPAIIMEGENGKKEAIASGILFVPKKLG